MINLGKKLLFYKITLYINDARCGTWPHLIDTCSHIKYSYKVIYIKFCYQHTLNYHNLIFYSEYNYSSSQSQSNGAMARESSFVTQSSTKSKSVPNACSEDAKTRKQVRWFERGKNDISMIFWFKWNGFICVYPLRLKLKIIVKSKLIEVLLRFLKNVLFKKFTSLIFFLEVLKESASFSAACGWYLFFILHNYRLYPQ